MAAYSPMNIQELIKSIEKEKIILPAMQRNFVWPEEKICYLFDSIMRKYPIGIFLFWKIDEEEVGNYAFNKFIKNFDEENKKNQRGEKVEKKFMEYIAVLDGQQRITSLYMGIAGKWRTHIKGKKWDDSEAYFDRFLCLDILFSPEKDEKYHLAFVAEEKINKVTNNSGKNEYWIKVGDVFAKSDIGDLEPWLFAIEKDNAEFSDFNVRVAASNAMHVLYNSLHNTDINYYSADNKSLSEVVDIFVRVNGGGQKLDASDLMLSVAAGGQGDKDIHKILQEAVSDINDAPINLEEGFKVDKELILTAGLLLTDSESLSLRNNQNYTKIKMDKIFKSEWENILEALSCAVEYIEYLGFIGNRLTSKNLLLPIAYYIYINKLEFSKMTNSSNRASCDRIFVRQWLTRAMMNNIFRDGTGGTLVTIRDIISTYGKKYFPLNKLMENSSASRSLILDGRAIDEILEISYGDSRVKPIFNELNRASENSKDQVDHIWPKSILISKAKVRKLLANPNMSDDECNRYKYKCHKLCNLQLLSPAENNKKSDRCFDEWVSNAFLDNTQKSRYCDDHFIPKRMSYEFKDFFKFTSKRESLLKKKLKEVFPSKFDEIVALYALEKKIK